MNHASKPEACALRALVLRAAVCRRRSRRGQVLPRGRSPEDDRLGRRKRPKDPHGRAARRRCGLTLTGCGDTIIKIVQNDAVCFCTVNGKRETTMKQ